MLHHFLTLLSGQATRLGNDLTKDKIDFPSHVGCISTDVKGSLLLEEIANKVGMLLQSVLDVYFLGGLTREGSDDLELVSKFLLIDLLRVRQTAPNVLIRRLQTYLPLLLVQEVLISITATKEQNRRSNVLATFSQSSSFLDEATERRNASTGSDHDDGFGRIRRQLEIGVANMDWDVNSIVLVARTSNSICQTMGIG